MVVLKPRPFFQPHYVKYTHQPVIVINTKTGLKRFIRAEGNITFKPMINSNSINNDASLLRFFNK